VKRLLLNCDQVFDVLTRGPFPTGEPEDEAVEQHLRACHECRQLAEALRPAVELLHEAMATEQAHDLPEYQGSLAQAQPVSRRLSVTRLAKVCKVDRRREWLSGPHLGKRRKSHIEEAISAVRFIAVSVLIVALAGAFYGGVASSGAGRRIVRLPQLFLSPEKLGENLPDGMPNEKGLLTLASLKLPVACLPATHLPISAEHAAELVAALGDGSLARLHCCTECHHGGLSQATSAKVATVSQNCQACHRG
jgi:hypothetical protein